jgi:hypothetical protein
MDGVNDENVGKATKYFVATQVQILGENIFI